MGLVNLEIDSTDFDLKIRALHSGMEEIGPKVIKDTIMVLEEELKAITPVRTGKLKASIISEVWGLSGEVSTNSGYGLFVDVDTKPHVIEGNPFLRFEIGNKVIFARRVFHPGTKGQNLRGRALKNTARVIDEIISRIYLDEMTA